MVGHSVDFDEAALQGANGAAEIFIEARLDFARDQRLSTFRRKNEMAVGLVQRLGHGKPWHAEGSRWRPFRPLRWSATSPRAGRHGCPLPNSVPSKLDPRGEGGTQSGVLDFPFGVKKCDLARRGGNPDLLGPGFEVGALLLRQFAPSVAGGPDLDADLGAPEKAYLAAEALLFLRRALGHIDCLDSVARGYGAFGDDFSCANDCSEQKTDFTPLVSVARGRGRRHDHLTGAVSFDAEIESRERGVGDELLPHGPEGDDGLHLSGGVEGGETGRKPLLEEGPENLRQEQEH